MGMEMSKRQVWCITMGGFLSYFLFGFIDNMKGTTIPFLLRETGYRYAEGGIIIFCEYAGFLIAALSAGLLADLFGKKITLILAGLCLMIGVLGYAAASNLTIFLIFIFFVGLGLGSLELSGSNVIADLYSYNKGRYLNLLNAFYGVSSVISPIATGHLLNIGLSWRNIYRCSLILIVLITVYFFIMRYPRTDNAETQAGRINLKGLIPLILKKKVLLMYIAIFSYVAAEIGMATWLVEFVQRAKGRTATTAAVYLAIYFAAMMTGRLLGSLFVDKVGHLKSLLIFSVMSVFFLSLGIFGPSSISIVLAFTGFGFSIIFPTSTAVISEASGKKSGTMLGIFFACGGLGGMAGPALIGISNDLLGLKAGMTINILLCIILTTALVMLITDKALSK